jgi:hypothetical protein
MPRSRSLLLLLRLRLAIAVAAALALPRTAPLMAQEAGVRVHVVDSLGVAVPYAVVQPANGIARVASDSGVVSLALTPADSLRLIVRRIGYTAFGGWVRRASATTPDYRVVLAHAARALTAVTVEERANTPLARAGFYDRMERVRRGAIVAQFITPEELETRNPARISQVLLGVNSLRVNRNSNKQILTGRTGSCPVTVLLDGRRALGMAEELYTWEGQREVARLGGGQRGVELFLAVRTTVDELISAMSVTAVEIYGNASTAPTELLQNAGSDPCAIVAIWTGSRR